MHTASNAPFPRRLSSMPRSGRSGMNFLAKNSGERMMLQRGVTIPRAVIV